MILIAHFCGFSPREKHQDEEMPLKGIHAPSDGNHRLLATQDVFAPSRSQTWRFHRSGLGCHTVPFSWERRSFVMDIGQGGVVVRRISSETKSGWASRPQLAALDATLPWPSTEPYACPANSCVLRHPCRGGPRSGCKKGPRVVSTGGKQVHLCLPKCSQISWMARDGVATLQRP